MMILILFLPIFGEHDGKVIRSVNLWTFTTASSLTKTFYLLLILLTIAVGVVGITSYLRKREWRYSYKILSALIFILAVVAFMLSQQPYPAFISFVLLILKFSVLFKIKE